MSEAETSWRLETSYFNLYGVRHLEDRSQTPHIGLGCETFFCGYETSYKEAKRLKLEQVVTAPGAKRLENGCEMSMVREVLESF